MRKLSVIEARQIIAEYVRDGIIAYTDNGITGTAHDNVTVSLADNYRQLVSYIRDNPNRADW